jgi:hypothetical protein
MKVWINVTVGDPPLEWLFDILDWLSKELLKLASPRPDVVGHRDVGEGGEVVVVVNRISGVRDCGGRSHFPLVASHVFFTHKAFCVVDPLLFPALLSEVLEL